MIYAFNVNLHFYQENIFSSFQHDYVLFLGQRMSVPSNSHDPTTLLFYSRINLFSCVNEIYYRSIIGNEVYLWKTY